MLFALDFAENWKLAEGGGVKAVSKGPGEDVSKGDRVGKGSTFVKKLPNPKFFREGNTGRKPKKGDDKEEKSG